MRHAGNLILALIITLLAILPTVALSNRVDRIERTLDALKEQANAMAQEAQDALNRQGQRVEEYREQVDVLYMRYRSLDEILKRMFDYEQARYMERER